jgi:methyltransferase (TIGR00027 family)
MSAQTTHPGIDHISDTAIWIAGFRAQESKRTDALFNDQYAEILAGERGSEMVETTPHSKAMAFAMVTRTVAIDELVFSAIEKGVEQIVNLAAGLDTRPYRLKIPPHIKWIEVDLPGLIQYKDDKLSGFKPVCGLERISTNLTNETERNKLFQKLADGNKNTLVITEGLIGYLSNSQAHELSVALFSTYAFRYWIMDYSQGKYRRTKQSKDLLKKLKNTPIKFDCADPIGFFKADGWKVCENRFILDVADKAGRKLPLMFPWSILMKIFPKKLREIGNKTYGYVMFSKP